MSLKVLKFGGEALESPEALGRVREIVQAELPGGGVVVSSARNGSRGRLLQALESARRGDLHEANARLAELQEGHERLAACLGLGEEHGRRCGTLFQRLGALVEGSALVREASARTQDAALAAGEILSAHLLADWLKQDGTQARFLEAGELLRTDGVHGHARPDLQATRLAAGSQAPGLRRGARVVVPGGIGQGPDGAPTTLGRGFSDTSATLLGEALDADEVQIWTQVDGILTADPSLVPEARPIPRMSFAEASALCAFGAKVLHADSLAPAARAGFPLLVANALRPRASRTSVLPGSLVRRPGEVTSVAYKEGVLAVRFPGAFPLEELLATALRLEEGGFQRFGLLSDPEGSLLVVHPGSQAPERTVRELESAGARVERGWAVVALVGEGLRLDPGAPARLLAPLAAERLGAVLGGGPGSVAFLLPEDRLAEWIPRLHRTFILDAECATLGT
ncbi:MAG: aspartate kinase [Acidobacteria bacterium]|nr:aspartate kinase [Acidobacteriota bacterium]